MTNTDTPTAARTKTMFTIRLRDTLLRARENWANPNETPADE